MTTANQVKATWFLETCYLKAKKKVWQKKKCENKSVKVKNAELISVNLDQICTNEFFTNTQKVGNLAINSAL